MKKIFSLLAIAMMAITASAATITLEITGGVYPCEGELAGYTAYAGYDVDEDFAIQLALPTGAGTYGYSDLYGVDNYPDGSYLVSFKTVGDLISFVDAVIEVYADASLHASLLLESGDVYEVFFNRPATTALSNTDAEVKAVKVIENGQVVILKGDKRFNLMGAEM